MSNIVFPVQDPFKDNVLLIGDATWMMEFSNMAALCCGWKAAHTITLAVTDHKPNREGISNYLRWWEKIFTVPTETMSSALWPAEEVYFSCFFLLRRLITWLLW